MQLFEKWQSVTDTYKSFYKEAEILGLEVSIFLKHFCEANDSNAIFKMFGSASLVKQYRDKHAVWIRQEHRKRFYLS